MKTSLNRRSVLRGMLSGTAVTVGLPLLDCFLNANGDALAAGGPLPKCFVSWFQGLGFVPGYWEPKVIGENYQVGPHLRAMAAHTKKMNVYSGMKLFLDQTPANAHGSGPAGCLQGSVGNLSLPTIDQLIADTIGTRTRFRSLEVSCDGGTDAFSRRSATAINAGEPDPAKLYLRIFGPDFKDPNAADFTPDPQVMVRESVLSGIKDKREKLIQNLGAMDKARVDEYFTSLRALENRLQIELEKPAPLESCVMHAKVDSVPLGKVVEEARATHNLHASLLAHAMACGQTQVAHLKLGASTCDLRRRGSQQTYHMYTHEEAIDPALGYQKEVEYFSNQSAEALAEFVTAFESIREGERTLLDRSVILYSTDGGNARTHSLENIPMLTIGGGNGAMKTGMHVRTNGDPITRVGLTVMQAMGVSIGQWGTVSNQTSKTVTDVMA